VTICTVAFYMFFNPRVITHNTFRFLVVGIVLSLLFDLFWFSLMSSEYAAEQTNDSGMENTLRKFSLKVSYVSFFFRIVIALVYWKDSLDFDNIMHGGVKEKPLKNPGTDSNPKQQN
jgi:Ca2+/Na+ antiporter